MADPVPTLSSLQNPRIKAIVRLRRRAHRADEPLALVEGYRELKRALDNRFVPSEVYFCEQLFLGKNEPALLERCRQAGSPIFPCTPEVFEKIAYRDRPEGLLALVPWPRRTLDETPLKASPLVVVAVTIEKPGNLGTILRSADAAGADAVVVCDRCTDILNPNVVRASIGTLFSLPVLEATTAETLAWLKRRRIAILAVTPHADLDYTEADLRRGLALAVGAEQVGLGREWMEQSDLKVRIPMHGQADSLNVAAATAIVLYEAIRQRKQ